MEALRRCRHVYAVFAMQAAYPDLDLEYLVESSEAELLASYGDAPNVLRKDHLMGELVALPHGAMLFLLRHNDVRTDAEASVLLLLWAWYKANSGNCSAAELADLRAGVRYSQLTVPYLSDILPNMPGLALSPGEAHALQQVPGTRGGNHGAGGVCPAGWYLPARRRVDDHFTLQLEIAQAELLLHSAAVAGMRGGGDAPPAERSEKVAAYGYDWTLSLTSATCKEALSLNLEMHSPLEGTPCGVVSCRVTFVLPRAVEAVGQAKGKDDEVSKACKVSSAVPCCVGDVLLNAKAVLDGDVGLGPWSKYLVRGSLCFKARVTFPRG